MKPARRPGALAVAIAGLAVVVAALSALLAWRAWRSGVSATPNFEDGATLAQGLLQGLCAVLTLVWLVRELALVRRAGAVDLSVGSWGAVLWWFVPIANLVMPVKAFAELRKAAIKPEDWQAVDGSPLIALWWTFWLISGVASAVLWRAMMADDQALRQVTGPSSFAADLFGAPAALLFALVVLGIDRHLQGLHPDAVAGSRPSLAQSS